MSVSSTRTAMRSVGGVLNTHLCGGSMMRLPLPSARNGTPACSSTGEMARLVSVVLPLTTKSA